MLMDRMKILLADDNVLFQNEVRDYLRNRQDVEIVACVNDGQKCLDILLSSDADVLILDMVMPILDGFGVLEGIKNFYKKPRIIALGNNWDDAFIEKILDMGVSYYMIKPVSPSDIYSKLNYFKTETQASKAIQKTEEISILRKSPITILEQRVSNIFISVGIPAHIKGYQFLREAVKLAVEDPDIINGITKRLYPSIAMKYSTTASKVERAIRHAIEVAWNRGKIENINNLFGIRIYNANEKPTNGEFIALVADKMLMEGAC